MGQFDSQLQRTLRPPTVVMRGFPLCIITLFVVRAVVRPDLESILTAVLFAGLLLPDVIAPTRYRPWISSVEHNHPLVGNLAVVLIVGCGAFLLLRSFLDRTPSALIAAALALIAVIAAALGRRRRTA
ncbi:hypothetical protein ACIA49_21040 [Kribbella sp. NPDC051587]|uniref:hypothetical protein n=1 Tax=Kribbella sp. NPDC051587 TaxID=3364119 RepID=UPI00379825B9